VCGDGTLRRAVPAGLQGGGGGHSNVIVDEVPPENEDTGRRAMEECPTGAISIQE
jgi:ferredoxin